jgi:hypothetical protein
MMVTRNTDLAIVGNSHATIANSATYLSVVTTVVLLSVMVVGLFIWFYFTLVTNVEYFNISATAKNHHGRD